jgi:hypothetical protein
MCETIHVRLVDTMKIKVLRILQHAKALKFLEASPTECYLTLSCEGIRVYNIHYLLLGR